MGHFIINIYGEFFQLHFKVYALKSSILDKL